MRKLLVVAALSIPLAAGCTVHQDTAPSPAGPSELALSLKMAANPDHIAQDGSQSVAVSVTAYDAGGHPIAVQVHLTVSPSGFGSLSTDANGNLITTTDASHPTTVTYIPPAATTGSAQTVTITGTMVGPNSVTSSTQQVSIAVTPAVAISGSAPSPVISVSPAATVVTGQTITFDGSGSCGSAFVSGACPGTTAITSYVWSFGDGSSATGSIVTHTYAAGTFTATLTVTNDKGLSASTTKSVTAAKFDAPSAKFVISPSPAGIGGTTVFDGSQSTAASGHSIVKYVWVFGDSTGSTTTTGPTVSHVYSLGGSYNPTLTVTDDLGQTASTSTALTVK